MTDDTFRPDRFVDVAGCARCGRDHPQLGFEPLTNPMDVNGYVLTHWAECPTLGEPILMAVTSE